jgi:hypothetical protein
LPRRLNADPDGQGLSLNITETDNSLDFEVALEVAEYFRLEPRDADRVLTRVKQAAARWRGTASELGIGRSEQEAKQAAFGSGFLDFGGISLGSPLREAELFSKREARKHVSSGPQEH